MKKIKVEQRAGGLTGLSVSKQETTGKTGPTHGTEQGIKGDTGFYHRLTTLSSLHPCYLSLEADLNHHKLLQNEVEAHLSLEQKCRYRDIYRSVKVAFEAAVWLLLPTSEEHEKLLPANSRGKFLLSWFLSAISLSTHVYSSVHHVVSVHPPPHLCRGLRVQELLPEPQHLSLHTFH